MLNYDASLVRYRCQAAAAGAGSVIVSISTRLLKLLHCERDIVGELSSRRVERHTTQQRHLGLGLLSINVVGCCSSKIFVIEKSSPSFAQGLHALVRGGGFLA